MRQAIKLLFVLHHRFELWNAPDWFLQRLRTEFPQIEVTNLTDYQDLPRFLPEAEVAITWSLRPEQFAVARKLRWIHSPAAAVHQLMFPELVRSDVVLTNAREVHGPTVAEHVIGLIFAMAKRLPWAMRDQARHVWGQEAIWQQSRRSWEVAGSTLGMVGLGSIGREVAKRASALGMRVIAVREHLERPKPEGVGQVFSAEQMDEFLAQADYVVLAAPITPSTRGLMNAARIAKMKPEACLINVGRGPLVDEPALIEALRSGRIAGAALDVFAEEPLPRESALWDLENVLITPHTAGLTRQLWERHYVLIKENLRRYLAGAPLLGVVDKTAGY